MDDETKEKIRDLQDGWHLVMQQGALIAMFPIEEWLEALERSETVAPFLDPTLYRDYLYSGKGPIIKRALQGALEFKRAILQCQKETIELEEAKNANAKRSHHQPGQPGAGDPSHG